ncbi:MAG: sigma-70 family RNA polymerase sigma factor [Ilumatobacteraceae bacterium]
MPDLRTDAELVTAYTAGDRGALAGIYDRFSGGLYDTAAAMLRDRHEAADAMQDVFLIAAERISQLREPERLKPWLYAILRNEVYRRTKKRGRSLPTDFSALGAAELAAPVDPGAEGEGLAAAELGELVRSAACGLDERDQLVLELSARQGLQGADLAAALGITAEQTYTLVHRMRDRVDRSIGALVVARAGRKDCPDLADVLKGWDGEFTVLVRKRVARHIEHCETCERTRRKAAPLALLGSAPAFAAPLDLRDKVLARAGTPGAAPRYAYQFDAEGGFPRLVRHARWGVAAVAALVVLLLGVGGGAILASTLDDEAASAGTTSVADVVAATVAGDSTDTTGVATTSATATTSSSPSTTSATSTTASVTTTVAATVTSTVPGTTPATVPRTTVVRTTVPRTTVAQTEPPTSAPATVPPTAAPAPGALTLSAGLVDLGATTSSASFEVRNPGGQPVNWAIAGNSGEFSLSPLNGVVQPGGHATITVTVDRAGRAEGDLQRAVSVTGDPISPQSLTLRARVEHAPSVSITSGPSGTFLACQFPANPFITATYSDESDIALPVVVSWSGPLSGDNQLKIRSPGSAAGSLLITDPPAGTYSYVVSVSDVRGNTGSAQASFVVTSDPAAGC